MISRMSVVFAIALALIVLVLVIADQQAPILVFKFTMVFAAAVAGFWLDWYLFPYARPGDYLATPWHDRIGQWRDNDANHPVAPGYEQVFIWAFTRRVIFVVAAMLAVGMGA